MTMFSIPMMEFEKAPNGWKCRIDTYPFRAHYIKLEGTHPTPWMLDHVECIREDMQEYLELMQHFFDQSGFLPPA
jgi:hypothetical protein